jgi:hypothetical protein
MIHLVGTFAFVRHEDVDDHGDTHRGREFVSESLTVSDDQGRRYFLSGSSGRIDNVEGQTDRFAWIRDGVLVGDGPLNNHVLDVEIAVSESDESKAVSEVVRLRLQR